MNEAFIYYEFYSIGFKIKKAMEKISDEIDTLLIALDFLISEAKKEKIDPQKINTMIEVYYALQNIKNFVNERLGVHSKMVMDLMRNELLKLVGGKICTFEDLEILAKGANSKRAIIECFKQNIITCRDDTDKFITTSEDEKILNVVYFLPNGTVERSYISYRKGYEKDARSPYPIVLAAYEKCLGVKVEVNE